MIQQDWLPVICDRIKPPPATAAADFIGIDDRTTHRWLCKGQSKHPLLPATEWICSRLAQDCGLPVPPFGVVELRAQPGVLYFGSQWQGGGHEFLSAYGRVSNGEVFARTHAIDLFSNNTDRHRNNYLYLELAGEIVARVIDFSHSLLVEGWPMPALPMASCNTTKEWPVLRNLCQTGYVRPQDILDQIASLDDGWMFQQIEAMPTQWLSDELALKLGVWWLADGRKHRLIETQSHLP